MYGLRRVCFFFTALILLSLRLSAPSYGEDRTKTGKIVLELDVNLDIGESEGEVTALSTGKGYDVEEIELASAPERWSSSDSPLIRIYLAAREGYYFSSALPSAFKLTSKNASDDIRFVSAQRQDDNTYMVLTVRLASFGNAYFGYPETVEWTGCGTGSWSPTGGTKNYQVQLYRDSVPVGPVLTSAFETIDLRDQITAPGVYKFMVRSVSSKDPNRTSSWMESPEQTVTEEDAAALKEGEGPHTSSPSSALSDEHV